MDYMDYMDCMDGMDRMEEMVGEMMYRGVSERQGAEAAALLRSWVGRHWYLLVAAAVLAFVWPLWSQGTTFGIWVGGVTLFGCSLVWGDDYPLHTLPVSKRLRRQVAWVESVVLVPLTFSIVGAGACLAFGGDWPERLRVLAGLSNVYLVVTAVASLSLWVAISGLKGQPLRAAVSLFFLVSMFFQVVVLQVSGSLESEVPFLLAYSGFLGPLSLVIFIASWWAYPRVEWSRRLPKAPKAPKAKRPRRRPREVRPRIWFGLFDQKDVESLVWIVGFFLLVLAFDVVPSWLGWWVPYGKSPVALDGPALVAWLVIPFGVCATVMGRFRLLRSLPMTPAMLAARVMSALLMLFAVAIALVFVASAAVARPFDLVDVMGEMALILLTFVFLPCFWLWTDSPERVAGLLGFLLIGVVTVATLGWAVPGGMVTAVLIVVGTAIGVEAGIVWFWRLVEQTSRPPGRRRDGPWRPEAEVRGAGADA